LLNAFVGISVARARSVDELESKAASLAGTINHVKCIHPFSSLPFPFIQTQGAHRRVGINFNLRGALLDTKGPEIRTGSFEGGVKHVEIPSGAEVILTTDPAWKDKGTAEKVYVDYGALGRTCKKGGNILLDDGIIKLEVIDPVHRTFPTADPTKPITETLCVVKNRNPVTLGARKGTNIPGAILELPALTERDKDDLQWGVENDVDFVAASFVRKAADVRSVIVHLERLMAKQKPTEANPRLVRPVVISKIENAEAIANFDEILAESDGIMVARGDLGVSRFLDGKGRNVGKKMVFICDDEWAERGNA
jgi:pyruvate kinase